MKCFYHNDHDAVGVCRHCLKGICHDCAIDFVDGIACKNTCENKAKETARLISTNINAQKGIKIGRYIGPSFAITLGLIFITWGAYCHDMLSFTGMAGIAFFTIGVVQLIYNLKFIKPFIEENS